MEKQVTIPVERALNGTPRVLIQRSITSFGLSQVILTFEDDVDIYWARQQVAERLPDAEVPDGIEPHLGPNDTPVGQVYQYTLESDHHSPSELRSWQDWVVSKHLMRAPGVADVVSFGGFQKEYHVLADPAELRANGLLLKDLIDAVGESNGATSGGYVQHGEAELVVRGRGYLKSPRDIENTVVRATGGTPVLVRNVAKVVEAYTPPRGAVARGAAIDSVEGTVLLRRGENPKEVLRAVHEAVERINHELLPPGMRIVPFYDRTRLVDTTLKTVSHNMLEGDRARQRGRLDVPARVHRLAGGVAGDAAGAADRVRRPLLRGRAREPVVDGGDRLRHPAGRGGHPGRERLPPPGAREAAARARCRTSSPRPPRRSCARRCSRWRSSARR